MLCRQVLRVALRREHLIARGFLPADGVVVKCRKEFHSPHPYTPYMDVYESVSFPGAANISIVFVAPTELELGDFVTVYKDKVRHSCVVVARPFCDSDIRRRSDCRAVLQSCTEFWGNTKCITGKGIGWPGLGGRPTLIVPSDHCTIYFHSVSVASVVSVHVSVAVSVAVSGPLSVSLSITTSMCCQRLPRCA